MQRLFSMFAAGAAGIALAILRACASGSLLACLFFPGDLALPMWIMLGVGIIVLLLSVGVVTPVACSIGGLIQAYCVAHSVGSDWWHPVFGLLLFLALGLLGPGAYSVDAKLFGRRRIVMRDD